MDYAKAFKYGFLRIPRITPRRAMSGQNDFVLFDDFVYTHDMEKEHIDPFRPGKRAADHERFFREVTVRAGSSLDIETALDRVMKYLRDFLPVESIGLYRFDRERRAILAVADVPAHRAHNTREPKSIPVDEDLVRLLEAGSAQTESVTIHEPGTLPSLVLQCFPRLATQSVISMRLMIDHDEVGGLAIAAEGRGIYTHEHVELLSLVMEPIALAMSNTWRFRELERLKNQLAEENRVLAREMDRPTGVQIIGADFGLAGVMDMVRRVAPLSSPVLLLGETGSGKEVIAHAIHLSSPRNHGPLVRVPCGAIPETLLDSELFGHEKGAFTGAIERTRGRFERARGGTIFLDEIGELTAEAQVKLLRVLQDREFERVGGTETLTTDARIIAATHRDLAAMVQRGTFREDLWYRLNVFPISIPPLRMRREDIPPLVQYFVERKARELNLERMPLVDHAMIAQLQTYDWPGNVRELQNVIERAIILSRGGPLACPEFPAPSHHSRSARATGAATNESSLDDTISKRIREALKETHGRVSGPLGAAARLHINPNTLRSKMRKLGIRVTRAAADSTG